jgi:hypothetical protein
METIIRDCVGTSSLQVMREREEHELWGSAKQTNKLPGTCKNELGRYENVGKAARYMIYI